MACSTDSAKDDRFDYIIVGSGAGGAPLAARLAQRGEGVLVIEAGPNQATRGAQDPGNEISRVPVLHAASSEHTDLSWRYFVEHYQRTPDRPSGQLPEGIVEDPKRYNPNGGGGEDDSQRGIFYPRASGIGGCTIHNAMITLAGPDADWDDLADFLRDDTWRSSYMRGYFKRLEHNDYVPRPKPLRETTYGAAVDYLKAAFLWLLGRRPDLAGGKHGFDGWLHTSTVDLAIGLEDKQLIKMLKAALRQAKVAGLDRAWTWVQTILRGEAKRSLDPNRAETQAHSPEGVSIIPLAVYGPGTTIHQNSATPYAKLGHRSSPRELLLETQKAFPDHLVIKTDCLVTQILLEEGPPLRAIGVEVLRGERLPEASVDPSQSDGIKDAIQVRPGGEVILAAGSFNTPQLLMLSGVGDPEELAQIPAGKIGAGRIEFRLALPGVGKNLQDRYEISVVSRMRKEFKLLDGAELALPLAETRPDRHLREWRAEGTGLYASNGTVIAILKRSAPDLSQPDLFMFGAPARFEGYKVGYSLPETHDLFTWVILKSHTNNRDGAVKLRSTDPRDTPRINFNSFRTKHGPRKATKILICWPCSRESSSCARSSSVHIPSSKKNFTLAAYAGSE